MLQTILTDVDVLILVVCVALTLIAHKARSWPPAFLSMVGLIILALRIFDAGQDLLLLGLMLAVAIIQVIYIGGRD